MARNIGRLPNPEALNLQSPQRRNRRCHQRRLRIGCECQRFNIAVPDHRRQLFTQSLVHLVKDSAGLRLGLGQGLAHPDGLGPLARKYIGAAHVILPFVWNGLPNTALARNAPTCNLPQNQSEHHAPRPSQNHLRRRL